MVKAHILARIETPDLPPPMRQAITSIVDHGGEPNEPPIYHWLSDDLPSAALYFRGPSLSRQHRYVCARDACVWCHAEDAEWGYHLLTCPHHPARLLVLRDTALRSIQADLHPDDRIPNEPPDAPANLLRLYRLNWRGHTPADRARKKYRSDTGSQPCVLALRQATWYMRELLNAYSASAHALPDGRLRTLRFRVYGSSPFPVP